MNWINKEVSNILNLKVRWWLKIIIKITISRLPISYAFFKKLLVFRHGNMDDPNYAFNIVSKYYNKANPHLKTEFSVLELGPGDSLLSALILTSLGGTKIYLVDSDEFASKEIQPYIETVKLLESKNLQVPKVQMDASSAKCFCQYLNYEYLTKGLTSLKYIPDQSIDFIWSHSVLEHIKLDEFKAISDELYRILKPRGICAHGIDLYDHLEESLHSLRIPKKIWESAFFSKSGFYTNRIRHDQMIEIFESSKFEVDSDLPLKWDHLPITKNKLSEPYCNYSTENLLIYWFDLVLVKKH